MANLKTEYTDIKDVKHHVEHIIVAEGDNKDREQLLEELFAAMTSKNKRIYA